MTAFLLHILISIIGAAGLVGALSFWVSKKHLAWFSALIFLAASILLSTRDIRWDFAIFNFQSILSSGTASLSAILYLLSQFRPQWRGMIFKSFLLLFKIIWVGVGIIGVLTVLVGLTHLRLLMFPGFPQDEFLFSQIIFAVLILNGVYIGKYIGFGLVQLMKQVPAPAPDKVLAMRIAASGSISMVSWYAMLAHIKGLTENLNFSLSELLGFYGAIILTVFVINIFIEQIRQFLYERPR